MLQMKICFVMMWLSVACFCLSDASPFLWLLGVRKDRSYQGRERLHSPSFEDLCRTHNPVPGTAWGIPNNWCP